jgi:hypothetical protein
MRTSNNADSYNKYLLERKISGSPVLIMAYAGTGAGAFPDNFYAKFRDDGTLNTDFMPITTFNVSSYYDQWIPFCFTHNGSNNTTYARVTDIATGTHSSNSVVQALGTHSYAGSTYFGGVGTGSDSQRHKGDMADWAFFDGLYMDVPQWEAWIRSSGQSWRHPKCNWHVPMLGDHEDEWVNQAAVTTTNLTSIYDGPPTQLHMPRGLSDPSELATPRGVTVAQHYAQVVGTRGQSSARVQVRRLYAEVLIGQPTFVTHNESVTSNLALTDAAVGDGDLYRSASSTLSLSDAAGRTLPEAASSTLNLTQEAAIVRDAPATSTLTLVHAIAAFNYVADRSPVEHTLNLVQTVTTLSDLGASSVLNFVQTVEHIAPIYETVTQALILTSRTSTPHRHFISQNLGISQYLNTPLPLQHVTHTLNFTHDSPIGRFDQTLNFTHVATYAFSQFATSTLNLTQNVQMNADWARSAEHTNFIGHALTWYEDSPCDHKQYTPFQGESTIPGSTVTAPEEDLQDPQGDTGNFSLRTPPLGTPTSQVILRNPELDNRDRNAFTRINNETRGGKLVVYADPTWPTVRTLAVTIVGLIETEVDGLHTFMQSTLGQEIGLTDWEGRLWKGVITNPNEAATQDGKGKWVVTFEFEGEMLDVEQPDGNDGSSLNFTQTVTAVIE